MPLFALANWNWGGRLHPLFYNLSIATQALLGLAVMVCRLVVLRYSEHEEDQEKGFVGNTILVAQPRPEEVIQKLPPPDAEVSKYLSVCFNSQAMTSADVGKHRALQIDPEEYIRCSELRKKGLPHVRGSGGRHRTSPHSVARAGCAYSYHTGCAGHGYAAHVQPDTRWTGKYESINMHTAFR